MAVATTQSWQEHTSDGSTAYFPFNFNYDTTRPGTIVVGKRTADNTYSVVDASNYELIPNAAGDGGQIRFIQNPSGSQIIDDIPPAGTIIRIERVSVDTSSATWQIGLEMSELVNLFDRLFRLVQENKNNFANVIKTFETQHNISLYELLSEHDNHLLYWDNTTQTLTPTDFPKEDVVRATDGMFLRISTDTAGNPYLEWSLTGTDNWHSVSDTAVEALSKINNHLADKNNPHETSMSKLTDTEIANLSPNQFIMFDGMKWKNVFSSATVYWGQVLGQLSNQTDLMNMFAEYVRTDGTSTMTGPLKMRASESFKCAIAPSWDGVGFFKLNDNDSVTLMASMEETDGLTPATNNKYNIGKSAYKWKDLYLSGKAYMPVINNGFDIAVPVTNSADTLALKSQVDLAANSGRMITDQGVWYAKMYAATVAPSAENGTNYADFSQIDGQGNPIIVIYERQNGAWVQSETITPPAEYDGYVPITSKIWDIAEQAGQQGGRILWNHQSKEFTPYPVIVSFENIEVTGDSTVIMPLNPLGNQIVNKNYVDSHVPTGGYHPSLFAHEWDDKIRNNVQWLRADTFSWQNGAVYEAGFNELFYDIQISTYWYHSGSPAYTKSRTPEAGDAVYLNSDLTTQIGTVEAYDDVSDAITISGDTYTFMSNTYVTPTTETVAGYSLSVYTGHSGRKIVGATDETNVANIYNATGIAWYYIIDISNKRFKLPRTNPDLEKLAIEAAVIGNGNAIGIDYFDTNSQLQTASLGFRYNNNGVVSTEQLINPAGLSVGSTGSNISGADIKNNTTFGLTTDATKSGMKADLTNTTSYYKGNKYLYFYVGEFTQTALENTAGITAETLNDKVDKGHEVIAFQAPTAENNYTWYRLYADGWVEQGGVVTLNGTISATNKRIDFPITMADTEYYANGVSDANVAENVYVGWQHTTYMTIGTSSGSSTGKTRWEVKGMASN